MGLRTGKVGRVASAQRLEDTPDSYIRFVPIGKARPF